MSIPSSTSPPESDSSSPPPGASRTPPIVGREPEIERLRELIERPAVGGRAVVFVTGEAGIGKTRLIEEACRMASGQGVTCLSARCEQVSKDVPYAPWISILRSTLRSCPRSAVRAAVGPSFEALVRLLPELGDLVWLVPRPGSEMRELSAGDFQRRLAEYFAGLSAAAPCLITIDDLAWGDAASLDLLGALGEIGAQSPLRVVVAARDSQLEETPRLQELLARLLRGRTATQLSLGRLDSAQVGRIIAGALSEPDVNREFVEMVFRRSEGNPFFVEEILASLIEQRAIFRTESGWQGPLAAEIRVPAGIRSVIHQRLWRLSERDATVLRAVAVLGTSVRVEVLKELLELPTPVLVDALEGAVTSKLLQEGRDASGAIQYDFSHPLIAEVLLEDLSLLRRSQLHDAAGRALERGPSGSSPEHAATLAFHYLRGETPSRALEYSITAGDHASQIYARTAAIGHYRTALKFLEEAPRSPRRSEVQERLADQVFATGDDHQAARLFDAAAEGFIEVGQPVRAADCLVKRVSAEHRHPKDALTLLQRARDLLPAGAPCPTQCRVDLQTVHVLYQEGRVREARRLAESSLELSVQLRLPAEEVTACLELAKTLPAAGRAELADLIERALRTAVSNHLEESLAKATGWRVAYLGACEGRLESTASGIGTVVETSRRVGNVGHEIRWQAYPIPLLLLLRGDFAAAAEMATKAGQRTNSSLTTGRPHAAVLRAAAAVARGDDQEAPRLLSEGLAQLRAHPHWYLEMLLELSFARHELHGGRFASAGRHLARARALGVRAGPSAWHAWLHALVLGLLVRVDLLLGDREKGRSHLAELERLATEMATEFPWGFVHRARSQIAAVEGEFKTARQEAQASIDIWRRFDWRYELAGALQDLAAASQLAGDVDASAESFAQAAKMYKQMGAVPEVDPRTWSSSVRPP